jgi:hypothetical protein
VIGRVPASSAQSKWLEVGDFGRFWSNTVIFACFEVRPGVVGDVSRDMVVMGGVAGLLVATGSNGGGSWYIGGGNGDTAGI